MPEQLLTILKLCLLALLYLFFLRVLRAVWTEVNPPKGVPADLPAPVPAAPSARGGRRRAAAPPQPQVLCITEPPTRAGEQWTLDGELTIGRHAASTVVLDEQFVSQHHARVFRRDGEVFVEDLGSTNGTWVNGERATGQRPVRPGDQLQVGNVVLEVR